MLFLIGMRGEEFGLSSSLQMSVWEDFLVLEWVKTEKRGCRGDTNAHKRRARLFWCVGLKKPMSALLMGLTGCGPQDCDTGTWGCNGKVARSLESQH